jgi:hypothetical protein
MQGATLTARRRFTGFFTAHAVNKSAARVPGDRGDCVGACVRPCVRLCDRGSNRRLLEMINRYSDKLIGS